MLKTLTGNVSTGGGYASSQLQHVVDLISDTVGLPKLEPGTMNVSLNTHFPLVAIDGVIGPKAFQSRKQCVKLKRCRLRRTGDAAETVKGVIVRPSEHEDPCKNKLWNRIEVMSHHQLREVLNLADGNAVEVQIEADHKAEEDWWRAPEAMDVECKLEEESPLEPSVLWISGLPSSGKSAFGNMLRRILHVDACGFLFSTDQWVRTLRQHCQDEHVVMESERYGAAKIGTFLDKAVKDGKGDVISQALLETIKSRMSPEPTLLVIEGYMHMSIQRRIMDVLQQEGFHVWVATRPQMLDGISKAQNWR